MAISEVEAVLVVAVAILATLLWTGVLASQNPKTTVATRNPAPTSSRGGLERAVRGAGVPVPAGAFKNGNLYPSVYPDDITPTGWMRAGLLTRVAAGEGKDNLLTLFQRPIGPIPNSVLLWEYKVEDRDGFVIRIQPSGQGNELENGDVINHVTGKGGPWKVVLDQPRYISMPPFSLAPVPSWPGQ